MPVNTSGMSFPVWLRVVVAAVAALWMSTITVEATARPRVLSIAQARSMPLGSRVTVEGTVSTPSGAFASSFFDQGFGLQDRSAGLYVSLQEDLGLEPQDGARVTGTLAESFGLLILLVDDADDVDDCARGPRLSAKRVSTADIGEATEGLLVSVKGTITQAPLSDLPYGYKFAVNDGSGEVLIFVNLETAIDVDTLALGQRVTVTGFSSQFDDHYEIDPRSPDDIRVQR